MGDSELLRGMSSDFGDVMNSNFWNLNLHSGEERPGKAKKEKEVINGDKHMKASSHTGTADHLHKRVIGEIALEKELTWHFKPGQIWHCISNGDVDFLSYLRLMVKQQHVRYMLIATWVMQMTDALEMQTWLEKGYVDRIDFYFGEIMPNSYRPVYDKVCKDLIVQDARVAVFRNHSKVCAGYGDQYAWAMESSANVVSNPRCENMTISIDEQTADFYKAWYDGIKSFQRDFDGWKPWQKTNIP